MQKLWWTAKSEKGALVNWPRGRMYGALANNMLQPESTNNRWLAHASAHLNEFRLNG